MNRRGFTVIEMIVVLVILGVVAIILGNVIAYIMQSYNFARNSSHLSQKAQLAMARIKIELTDAVMISAATPDQIDYTLSKSTLPSCAADTGCQYSIKRAGTAITIEGTNPVVTPAVLIDGLTANNNGNIFLRYYQADGTTAWTTTNGFSTLTKIQVVFSLDNETGRGVIPLKYECSINPRANTVINAPQPN